MRDHEDLTKDPQTYEEVPPKWLRLNERLRRAGLAVPAAALEVAPSVSKDRKRKGGCRNGKGGGG